MRLNYLIMRQGCHNYERARHTDPREKERAGSSKRRRGRPTGSTAGNMASQPRGEEAQGILGGWSDRVINIQSTPDRANNFLPSST